MRLAVDATPLIDPSGGIRRYVLELVDALRRLGHEILLASDQPLPHVDLGPQSALERRWWSCGLPLQLRRARVDAFLGTSFLVPFLPSVPSTVMIHDLSPWREPDPLRSHLRRRGSLLYRLRIPRRYLTPTRAIAAELSARFRIPLDRITPTPLAAAAPFQTAQTPREPFLLFVGTLESRKNLQLLGALTQFADVRVAGRQPARPTELPPGVQTLGQVSDPELARLYQTAAALVFPSRYEGFGLPILEAMQSGCPVIASKIPALEEVAGDAAVLLPPDAPRLWAETAQKFLHSSALAQDFRQRGLARARLFTWDQTARRTLEAVALTL